MLDDLRLSLHKFESNLLLDLAAGAVMYKMAQDTFSFFEFLVSYPVVSGKCSED